MKEQENTHKYFYKPGRVGEDFFKHVTKGRIHKEQED